MLDAHQDQITLLRVHINNEVLIQILIRSDLILYYFFPTFLGWVFFPLQLTVNELGRKSSFLLPDSQRHPGQFTILNIFIFTNTVITDYKSSDPHLNSTHYQKYYAGIVCFVKQAQYVEVLVNNTMFSFKQLEYYIASEVIYHIRCYNGNKQRYSLTDRRERQGEGWNANFCRLSHTAGLTVWHVWWMVLHWYCWPLTSTHCHQSRDKEEEKSWGGGHPAAQAAEAVDASFHHLTHKRAHTHADAPFSPHKSTGTNIKAHTHSNAHSLLLSHPDNLYPTAVCICWAKPFSFWLLNQFSLSPDRLHQRLMQQLQPYETKGFWDYAKKQVFHHKLHICYTSHCKREWIRGEVHTGKQLEIKNGTGRGKLLCWQGTEQSLLVLPPRHRERKSCETAALASQSALMGLFKRSG